MLNRPKRTRGCERPFSQPQLTATSGQLVFTALTYIMFGVCVDSPEVAIPVVIYSIPVIFLLASWAYCVSVDPAEPAQVLLPCWKTRTLQDRYCRLCNKVIPGLDHHCEWLNTCIGSKNYAAFFILATAGLVQHVLEVLFGILTATVWRNGNDGRNIAFGTVISVCGCVGVASFGSLWIFHVYLLRQGFGTYDYLLQKSTPRMEIPPPSTASQPTSSHTVHTRNMQANKQAIQSSPPSLIDVISQKDEADSIPCSAGAIAGPSDVPQQGETTSTVAAAPPVMDSDEELARGLAALKSRALVNAFGNTATIDAADLEALRNRPVPQAYDDQIAAHPASDHTLTTGDTSIVIEMKDDSRRASVDNGAEERFDEHYYAQKQADQADVADKAARKAEDKVEEP